MCVKSVKPAASILDKAGACDLLHQGGEADVYELSCGENRYALKWYHPGCRFEGSVVDRLKHLNVPGLYRVRESGVRDNTPYLVYDFADGVSSADVPAMPVSVALKLLRGIVQTLDVLNKEDIHHGDINPSNILLCKSGNSMQPLVIDCGIVGPGALAYAAPERFQGRPASTKSDLYSLGMLLFRWIAGADLLASQDYNELVAQAMAIDSVDVSSCLYEINCCSAKELSALSNLWKALLRASPEDRAEDHADLLFGEEQYRCRQIRQSVYGQQSDPREEEIAEQHVGERQGREIREHPVHAEDFAARVDDHRQTARNGADPDEERPEDQDRSEYFISRGFLFHFVTSESASAISSQEKSGYSIREVCRLRSCPHTVRAG